MVQVVKMTLWRRFVWWVRTAIGRCSSIEVEMDDDLVDYVNRIARLSNEDFNTVTVVLLAKWLVDDERKGDEWWATRGAGMVGEPPEGFRV